MQLPSPPLPGLRVRTLLRLCRPILLAIAFPLVLLAALACGADPVDPPPATATATPTTPDATEAAPHSTATPTPDEQDEPDEYDERGDDAEVAEGIPGELRDRSFRQFEPHRDGNPRKAVILDFFGPGILLWAQYAEGAHAVDEWEIRAAEYRVEWDEGSAEATIHFENARYTQTFPEPCEDCVDVSAFSLSVRNVFDPARIEFRLNDPVGALPSPFPVFGDWTRFIEDEIFE